MSAKANPKRVRACSKAVQISARLFTVYVVMLVGLLQNPLYHSQAQIPMPAEMVAAGREHQLETVQLNVAQAQLEHDHQPQHEPQVQPQVEPHQQQDHQDQTHLQAQAPQHQAPVQVQVQQHQPNTLLNLNSQPQSQQQPQTQPQTQPQMQQQQQQAQVHPQIPSQAQPRDQQQQPPMQRPPPRQQQQQLQQLQPQQQPHQQQPQPQSQPPPQIQTQPLPPQTQQHTHQAPQVQQSQPQQVIQSQQPMRLQQPQSPPLPQQQQQQPSQRQLTQQPQAQPSPPQIVTTPSLKYQPSILSPLYLGHNPFIEILRPLSYADDNIVTLNLSHSHIYEIDSDAFVGQRFEHIDLSNNKLGLIHSRSFRIGPNHSRHTPFDPRANSSSLLINKHNSQPQHYPTRRPPPAHPKSVTIDLSHNPAIVALSGAFDHIDVPNCLLNFTNSTVELKFGAFKKYFKEHPGHLIDIDTVDCCDQEWLLGYKHNFVARTHCAHDPNLYLLKVAQQTIIDSCIAYVTSARHSMTMPSSGIIHSAATNGPRHSSGGHGDNQQYLTYLILGGTAMILTSLSIYIIFYMFSLKAAFVNQMQTQKS